MMIRLRRSTFFIAAGAAALFLAVFAAGDAYGQDNVNRYVARLGVADAQSGARASVSYEPDVEAWLVHFGQKSSRVDGYRICIFHGSGQDDRPRAGAAVGAFRAYFPDISYNTIYNIPTWRVVVGNCLNLTETTIMLGHIRLKVSAHAFRFPEQFKASAALRGFAATPVAREDQPASQLPE